MKTFVVSYGQNATPAHRPLLGSLKRFCEDRDAELLIVPGRYRNPTSRWSAADENDDWWDAELAPYIVEGRRALSPRLSVYFDISIQPTAIRPLNGFEPFLGRGSGIFGHPKRALEVVPDGGRTPRIMWTTGAVTTPNYSSSRAGKRAEMHHALGALVVEVNEDGLFFCRHLCANEKGEFVDLGRSYSPKGVKKAPPALSLTLGDYHAGQEDEAVLEATEALVVETRPENLILHDVLDFHARNHHRRGRCARYDSRFDSVEVEVKNAVGALRRVQSWAPKSQLWVVRSNHDEAFERWLEETDPTTDPTNAEFYHRVWADRYRWRREVGSWGNCFALQAAKEGLVGVTFLGRDSSLVLGDVEHAFHGDKGPSGSKGSTQSFLKVGVRVTKGHDHTPAIRDGVYSVGVTGALDQNYNDPPSTWVHAHVLQYADGKRIVVTVFNGRYKGDGSCLPG